MNIITSKNCGFCFGVQNAVDLAKRAVLEHNGKQIYTLGKLIHNELVTGELARQGVLCVDDADSIEPDSVVIIRSHGVGKDVLDALKQKNAVIIDATCPFVKKIQTTVSDYYLKGYRIVILGERGHPEVIGINGWCENSATVIRSEDEIETLAGLNRVCVVAQTTFPVSVYGLTVKKIQKLLPKSVEIFDTICYTTSRRQSEAVTLSQKCDAVLVLGSHKSSNTAKLFEICKANCSRVYLLETAYDLQKITLKASDCVGVVAGASTPPELIREVKNLMAQQFDNEINDADFIAAMEGEGSVALREGKRVSGTVITADEQGVTVNIGHKKDGFIAAEEAALDEYNPADFVSGAAIEAVVLSTKADAVFPLSKKRVDMEKEGNKQVETIRDGSVFELKMDKDTKGGLLGKLGSYTVFVPVSQIKDSFVRDLKPFVGKTLRLTAIEIDDAKHKIVASARKVVEEERKAREDVFWAAVRPDVIVSGRVKRITGFGAFVSVDGFDCLVRIGDISWSRIKSADEVLKIGQEYDFLVLSVDRELGRVSLSYKLLQADPMETFLQNHPIGSIAKGKVTLIKEFGAFVEIEPGIEGLVHVSEAAHSFVANIGEVVKIGEEIDVMILNVEMVEKKGKKSLKITLSMKACKPDEAPVDAPKQEGEVSGQTSTKPKSKKAKSNDEPQSEAEWSEESQNNPFAELLQGVEVDKE